MVGRIETMGVNAIYRYWYAEVVTPFVVSIDILLVVTMTVVGAKEPDNKKAVTNLVCV
jgi:hypothetical protein